jgi:hypothetical protein
MMGRLLSRNVPKCLVGRIEAMHVRCSLGGNNGREVKGWREKDLQDGGDRGHIYEDDCEILQ